MGFLMMVSCQGPQADEVFEKACENLDEESLAFLWWESPSVQKMETSRTMRKRKATLNENLFYASHCGDHIPLDRRSVLFHEQHGGIPRFLYAHVKR